MRKVLLLLCLLLTSSTLQAGTGKVEELAIVPVQDPPIYDLGQIEAEAVESIARARRNNNIHTALAILFGARHSASNCAASPGLEGLCAMADAIGAAVSGVETTARTANTTKSTADIITDDVTSDPALSADLANNIDTLLKSNLVQLMFSQEVATFIGDKTPIRLHSKSVEGTAFELKTQITAIESEGNMRNAAISIRIHAEASLYQRESNEPLKTYQYSAETPEYFVENWSQGGTALLSRAFTTTLAHLAEVISEEVLMTTTSPSLKRKGYLLGAIAPTNKLCIMGCKFTTAKNYGFRRVEGLRPTFEWQDFTELYGKDPLDAEQELSPEDISYDLRLFHAESIPITPKTLGAGTLVREYRELPTNSFTLEDPLEHCAAYMWTVRARFNLDGKTFLTHWSGNFNEKQIEEFRRKQYQDSGAVKFNARGAGFLGSDQQYFYRENSYYFPFVIVEPGRKCVLKPSKSGPTAATRRQIESS